MLYCISSLGGGFWHVPFQLSGIQQIEGVSPLRMAMIFPFGIMITGLIIGWLWLRTQSIWLVALAHGALNNWGQYAFKYMKDFGSPSVDMVAFDAGDLMLLLVGVGLLWRGCGVVAYKAFSQHSATAS